jgi:hypothetical protein
MIRHHRTRDAAIEQAHAYDVEADTDDERAYWRAVLVELRACSAEELPLKSMPSQKPS